MSIRFRNRYAAVLQALYDAGDEEATVIANFISNKANYKNMTQLQTTKILDRFVRCAKWAKVTIDQE